MKPAVAVLDVEMAGIGGIEAARRIRDASPGARIVALTMYSSVHYRQQMQHAGLSERERVVLRLLAEGQRTATIAHTPGNGPRTVETYRARLQQKPGINDLSGPVRFAIRAGLVSPES